VIEDPLEESLAAYDFGRALELARDLDADRREDAEERIERLRESAVAEATTLNVRVVELNGRQDFRALAQLAHDPRTRQLLSVLPVPIRQRSEMFLREGERWGEQRRSMNVRRLEEAARAAAGLDIRLAKALAAKLDADYLDEGLAQRRDELILELTAREMELDDLDLPEPPAPSPPSKRRWWRRG